jgi:bud site selection protein 20
MSYQINEKAVSYEQGQWSCIACNRKFIDQNSFESHNRSKVHKKQSKRLQELPYTQQEAEAAAGMRI